MRRPERPVTLDEVEDRKLPNSGIIKLTDIMTEFYRDRNNLLSFAGATAGVPSIPPLKLSDFYGKENNSGAAPFGNYDGFPVTRDSWRDSAAGLTWFRDGITGDGRGNPVKFPNYAGAIGSSIYGDPDDVPGWLFFVGPATYDDVDEYNRYPNISLQITGLSTQYFAGRWELRFFDGWPHAQFLSSSAGAEIRDAMDRSRGFFASCQL